MSLKKLLKNAAGAFVEFEETPEQTKEAPLMPSQTFQAPPTPSLSSNVLDHEQVQKFDQYFDNLLEKANLPGPDYHEFSKTMGTLEAYIADEKSRISASYASLAPQGLTKDKLLSTANEYKLIIENDRKQFESAISAKLNQEVGQRKATLEELQKNIALFSEQIQTLTTSINDAQTRSEQIKKEISEEENKLAQKNSGYLTTSQAKINKITEDINKIQNTIN